MQRLSRLFYQKTEEEETGRIKKRVEKGGSSSWRGFTQYQSGSFSLINVGSGFSLLRFFFFFLDFACSWFVTYIS